MHVRRDKTNKKTDGRQFGCAVGKKKIIFPEFDCLCSHLVSCTEQFPLAVQITFQKKQMLQALCEFLKCRRVVVNSEAREA